METRRIVDQFAERKGNGVWETNITLHGLDTLRKLLKATARKNTAVACHLIKARHQTELLWIVGNHRKFNREGNVPTNVTFKDVLKAHDENDWSTGEAIAILARLAGLFHDFGKANALFQKKIKRKSKKSYEPFRHEWLSLLLFRHFVKGHTDREWLEKLSLVDPKVHADAFKDFPKDFESLKQTNPLKGLPNIAKLVGWLILSHHRLCQHPSIEEEPRLKNIDDWMEGKKFSASWNSRNCEEDWTQKEMEEVVTFSECLPIQSKTWCQAAKKAALIALKNHTILDRDWFQDRFTTHLSRLALMLSDHLYSAGPAHPPKQDSSYLAYANTDRKTKSLKQKLDEHNIGVAQNAFIIAKHLPKIADTLPAIVRNKKFKTRSKDKRFSWQDKAFDLALSLKSDSDDRGFFGINLASTGCGKTLANARIMYALSDEAQGCRFSIALGLRVLTLQTGDALKEKLSLGNDDLAVMIGSPAFQHLHELKNEEESEDGSQSAEELVGEEELIEYEGTIDDGPIGKWFESSPKLRKLVSAPILVCTIDHLISATEGVKGGKQIGPILRLLTSDLILDEPDDFDVSDLPALCRLVNFAGVFGSRVLLSSATLTPSIVKALFDAYCSGRKIFNQVRKNATNDSEVCCAWFDEFNVSSSNHGEIDSYLKVHESFVNQRIEHLRAQETIRRGSLSPELVKCEDSLEAKKILAKAISQSIYQLHDHHHQAESRSGKKLSIGLVRMANIDPMIAVAKELLDQPALDNYCIHFCLYHSKFPLLIRSKIEEVLDTVLTRHYPEKIWELTWIKNSLADKSETNHIFVVFATSVAEVGRDHDYDWAIVEPSSLRSIIQLAGRVQRHRRQTPKHPNLILLRKNFKALKGNDLSFQRPGFESSDYRLCENDLLKCLRPEEYEMITSIPRLKTSSMNFDKYLVDLEHNRLEVDLFGDNRFRPHASLWWKHPADWSSVLQKMTPFRKSDGKDTEYIYYVEEEDELPKLYEWPKGGELIPKECFFKEIDLKLGARVYPWFDCEIAQELQRVAGRLNLTLRDASLKFSRLTLRSLNEGQLYMKNPYLGFYQELN